MSNDIKILTAQEVNDLQANAVKDFVNMQVGAFERGFVDTNEVSLYSLYRSAQHYVKDNYGIPMVPMSSEWGEPLTDLSKNNSEIKKG